MQGYRKKMRKYDAVDGQEEDPELDGEDDVELVLVTHDERLFYPNDD